jgi:hypothetical protein
LGREEALTPAFGRAQVEGGDDFGLAVYGLALAQEVIGLAAHDFLGEARHSVRSYNRQGAASIKLASYLNVSALLLRSNKPNFIARQ